MACRATAEPDATGPETVDDARDESAAEGGDELLDEQAARDKANAAPIEQLTSGIGRGDLRTAAAAMTPAPTARLVISLSAAATASILRRVSGGTAGKGDSA